MKTLEIRWQRLVDGNGRTCDRCRATEVAIEEAVAMLSRSLKELGVCVVHGKESLDPRTFAGDPLESNRIWIGGKAIEEWLQASVGKSRCCSACGDSDCRTIAVDDRTYEGIPAELIVRAGLLAAGQLQHAQSRVPCCPSPESPRKRTGCCSPMSTPGRR